MKYSYWLDNISGIGAGKIKLLMDYVSDAEAIYHLSEEQLCQVYGLTQEDVAQIINSKKLWDVDEEWMIFGEKGIGFVTIEQNTYPRRLRTIPNPPYALYYKGHLPEDERMAVGIVGARGRSAYGSSMARKLAMRLAEAEVSVISGLARGIDADGHIGALDAQGKTYAVLGCGVDVCYPKENRYLYERILQQGGGILSEYPPGTQPQARQFPSRNRIISGLSDVSVVIEARKKSGSLITADFAMEQGRDVYALPGRVTDSLSQGCNQLIKQGAGILSDVDEFVQDITNFPQNLYTQVNFYQNLLEKDETLVYSLLDFSPIGLGSLIEKTPFQLMELLSILERLEEKGFAKEIVPNFYVKNI